VTKPILYRHFDDKRALYRALLERHRDDLARFPAAMPVSGTLEERLRAVLELWVTYVETHSYAWRMLFRDTGGGPDIQAFRGAVHDRARAVLADMIAGAGEGRIPAREHQPLAELMSMGMASLVLWWMENPDVPRRAIVDAMTRAWTGLLAAP
jgi:AcrR family transcriptional regulator